MKKRNTEIGGNFCWDWNLGIDVIYMPETIYAYDVLGVSIRHSAGIEPNQKNDSLASFPHKSERSLGEVSGEPSAETLTRKSKSW